MAGHADDGKGYF